MMGKVQRNNVKKYSRQPALPRTFTIPVLKSSDNQRFNIELKTTVTEILSISIIDPDYGTLVFNSTLAWLIA
jgi:hypothetical protein